MPGQDRVLDRGQDRLLEADDGREDLHAGRESLEQVGAELFLDRSRAPAGGPQLGDGGGARGDRHARPQLLIGVG